MPQLVHFSTAKGVVKLVEKIGSMYSDFGVLLLNDNDGSLISAIEREKGRNASDITRHICQLWLQGKGKQPVTWATLVAVLRDIDLRKLAEDIEELMS